MAERRVRTYDEALAQYARERSQPEWEPVRLGFDAVDADLRGISAGQVCGVAARTGVGKTFLLNSVTGTFANRREAGQLALSLEMPAPEWVERQLAMHADIAPEEVEQRARHGGLGDVAGGFLEQMRNGLVVEDALTLGDLSSVVGEARGRLSVPLRLITVDYLGLLQVSGRDAYDRASTLGRGLKAFAKRERVAVVVATQTSRAAGDGYEPVTITMLRDSGVIEESLDFLLAAWAPGKDPNLPPTEAVALRDVMRVAVLKNRKGHAGRVVDLRFGRSRRLQEAGVA